MSGTERGHWDRLYASVGPYTAAADDPIAVWIRRYVPRTEDGSCIEIGCYPGRYLAVFGELGYELSGVDLAARLDELPPWLAGLGCRIGEFRREDFFTFDPGRCYDVVASFGFIEHFSNWPDVLDRHAALVRDGGLLVIEAPNFTGAVQRLLHRWLDGQNLRRHNLDAIDEGRWAGLLCGLGFTIIHAGCIGSFHFWTEEERRGPLRRAAVRLLESAAPRLARILPRGVDPIAPYRVLVARKG